MAQMKMRRPRSQKRTIARAIISHPTLTAQEKKLALYLLKEADENGVIKDPALNAFIEEVEQGVRAGGTNGSH